MADYYEEEAKFEAVSKVCGQAVSEARLAAKLSQEQLAKKVGEKTSVIVDIENATGEYIPS